MRLKVLAGTLGAVMTLMPLAVAQDDRKPSPTRRTEAKGSGVSEDMRQAIEWERAKDRAAARQAAIEARKGGRDREADRVADDQATPGRRVKDTKAPGAKKDR